MDDLRYIDVTIGAGASLSGAGKVLPELGRFCGYITDAAWDTNAVSFQGSIDGTNYFNVYNEATEYSQAGVTASTYHRVDIEVFSGLRYIKVRSGTAAAAVNQGDATVIRLVAWGL